METQLKDIFLLLLENLDLVVHTHLRMREDYDSEIHLLGTELLVFRGGNHFLYRYSNFLPLVLCEERFVCIKQSCEYSVLSLGGGKPVNAPYSEQNLLSTRRCR